MITKTVHLQHWETESTTANTDDVVVDSHNQTLERGTSAGNRSLVSGLLGIDVGGGLETRRALHDKRDVGELTVVGRTKGVDVVHVERVAVHVVTSLTGDRGGLVPGLNE